MNARSILILLFMLCFCCTVQGSVLDFKGLGLSNGQAIPQSYGEAGNLNVLYVSGANAGNTTTSAGSLFFRSTRYLGATNVAYGNPNTAEIFFQPIGAFQVQLVSF